MAYRCCYANIFSYGKTKPLPGRHGKPKVALKQPALPAELVKRFICLNMYFLRANLMVEVVLLRVGSLFCLLDGTDLGIYLSAETYLLPTSCLRRQQDILYSGLPVVS